MALESVPALVLVWVLASALALVLELEELVLRCCSQNFHLRSLIHSMSLQQVLVQGLD